MKKTISLILLSLLINFCFGQTTLVAGDIAITGVNTFTRSEFSFVLLAPITSGTVIYFTDNGWQTSGSFRTGEGIVQWTATTDLPCGTEVIIKDRRGPDPIEASIGNVIDTTGGWGFAGNGDQLLAYQGTLATPTFLFAIHFATATSWTNATNQNTTAIPSGLTDGVNALHITFDNNIYDCSILNGAPADILAAVSNVTNWTGSDSMRLSMPTCSFVCAMCTSTTTWDGSIWDNGGPNLTTTANIDGAYNTGTNGNLIACTLIVSNNTTLTVADNTHITIEGDITVDSGSSIEVQPYGAVVQNDDSALVTNNGSIQVTKKTALLNAWYEYTYWSSPVSGETIGGGLFESEASRRFVFNAQNYLDATAETNNNNATVAGQDGIDDNGNDWQWVSGSAVMTPGVGYAATHSQSGFIFSGVGYDYIFEGAFNNGVITVPIYRNDSELADENPNLIGNPYPSAIDSDLFILANPSLDGVINLWSQNTAPSSTENGNQAQNFSTSDYAKINGASQTAGGDGVMPNRLIPSGQAFFVSMDNAAAPVTPVSGMIFTTDVTFNNSMRVSGATDNSQFFKNSNKTKKGSQINNKLWVNLTSDNGLFHQISVAYVNGATNQDDGAYYDAERVITPNTFSGLYSTIGDKKFAIQGREPGSLDENEVIKLGFKTSIEVATLYKLSIADIRGDFLTNNTVYLKDNLLNKTHNLSESDYTFTSEVGEFNERFEIVFNNAALSITDVAANPKDLRITEFDNDMVQFSVTENLEIQSVTIYDLLGRNLNTFKGNSNKELFNLSELSSSVFIAEVTLSNGLVLSKKAVKK